MSLEAKVEPLGGRLPAITWRWDTETDILSGSFKGGVRSAAGLTGTVELTDEEGSVAVLDVANGVIRGLDIVVWPEVTSVPGLAPPEPSRDARVLLPSRLSQPGVASLEVDTTLSISTNETETVFHLRIGSRRQVETVRLADHLLVEVDQKRRIAGFWLTDVTPFPGREP